MECNIVGAKFRYSKLALEALEQELKTGYISIDDVMSVFDDFMRGDADENDREVFLEMLKDKAGGSEE